jgi:hypothetical protein
MANGRACTSHHLMVLASCQTPAFALGNGYTHTQYLEPRAPMALQVDTVANQASQFVSV